MKRVVGASLISTPIIVWIVAGAVSGDYGPLAMVLVGAFFVAGTALLVS